MHGLPTLQYLNDAQHGEGSATAKAIVAEIFGEKKEVVLPTPTPCEGTCSDCGCEE